MHADALILLGLGIATVVALVCLSVGLAALWAGWLSITRVPAYWIAASAVHLLAREHAAVHAVARKT